MKVIIINGPNLNLVGEREPGIYGSVGPEKFLENLKKHYPDIEIIFRQSNIEGELVGFIQEFRTGCDGMIINAGAYTHTSIAIADAIKMVEVPVIEVHLSQIFSRETFRHVSYISPNCRGVISGFGWSGYEMALLSLTRKLLTDS